MNEMMTTKEVARYLSVNEKMVYTLISEKGLPATKVTGKWLFPQNLVEQWLENNAINFPEVASPLARYQGLLVLAGSNDILLDRTIGLFNETRGDHLAVFANLGSMGGIRALRRQQCHIAASHLLQENGEEYNFDAAQKELEKMPVVVNFCSREQGVMLARGNPLKIRGIQDFGKPGLRLANRPLSTGTRLLLDRELVRCGIRGEQIAGYDSAHARHMDAGLEVLAGRADAAPGIRPVAFLLGLDFLPLRWERYDLLIAKEHFFEKSVQTFLSLFHDPAFQAMANSLEGYDTRLSGQMVFQR
ncbi:MAG: helix-turn-helix transcriptional regulator [Pseudomonadota bacterium]